MKVKIIAVVVVILLLTIFAIDWGHNRRYDKLQQQITAMQLENQQLRKMVNDNGDTISVQKVIITSSQEALRSLTDSIFSLTRKQERQVKNIIAYFSEKVKVEMKEVEVPYVDTIAMKKFSDSILLNCKEVLIYMRDSTITVPRLAQDSTSLHKVIATVSKEKMTINSLSIPDSSYFRIDEIKGGLFKRNYEIKSFHTSPYIYTTNQNSVIFKPKPKRNLLLKSLLIGFGVFVGTKL